MIVFNVNGVLLYAIHKKTLSFPWYPSIKTRTRFISYIPNFENILKNASVYLRSVYGHPHKKNVVYFLKVTLAQNDCYLIERKGYTSVGNPYVYLKPLNKVWKNLFYGYDVRNTVIC